jgi:hypothetical protein
VRLLVCNALVGGGCGASSSSSAGSHADAVTTSSVSGASAPAALIGVRGRVLVGGEMPGYSPQGRRLLGINARSWVFVDATPPPQRIKDAAFLNHLGFVAGVRESLRADGGPTSGLSTVEEFHSAVGAGAERSSVVKQFLRSSHRSKASAVPRIPGARGLASPTPAWRTSMSCLSPAARSILLARAARQEALTADPRDRRHGRAASRPPNGSRPTMMPRTMDFTPTLTRPKEQACLSRWPQH